MNINFKSVKHGVEFGPEEMCGICHDDKPNHLMNHANGGERHIFHAQCIEEWIRKRRTCPTCFQTIVPQPRDRLIIELKDIGGNALNGAHYGSLLRAAEVAETAVRIGIAGEVLVVTLTILEAIRLQIQAEEEAKAVAIGRLGGVAAAIIARAGAGMLKVTVGGIAQAGSLVSLAMAIKAIGPSKKTALALLILSQVLQAGAFELLHQGKKQEWQEWNKKKSH